MSTFSSQPPNRRVGNTSTHNDSESLKRNYGGGPYTPYSKKRPDNADKIAFDHAQRLGAPSTNGVRNIEQTKYMGPTAIQAPQILNTQALTHNALSVASTAPNTMTNLSSGQNMSLTNGSNLSQANTQTFSQMPTLTPTTQLQMFTKQSTLDPHINQSGTPTQNCPLPTLHLLPT